MRSRGRTLFFAALCAAHAAESGPWQRIVSSAGIPPNSANVTVIPSGDTQPAADWAERAGKGEFLILEGGSVIAAAFGFRPTPARREVRSVEDVRAPHIGIVWQDALTLPVFEVPQDAVVFTREKWEGAPLVAGLRRGSGAVLWTAAPPGPQGYERFPYLAHALADLGLEPPIASRRLWAFFDSSYRLRADPDYLAAKWRQSGIAALHVAAWHYFEPDGQRDAYLKALVEACHRHAILVYAWLELPHVSEQFWERHPEWREKTALGTDAHLDWRKLMNLVNPECRRAVSAGVAALIGRFDWDGVNLAELYFESLEGHANPSRFTPLNAEVRAEFTGRAGFDPADLFDAASPRHYAKNAAGLRAFLEFRVDLAQRMQAEWIAEIDGHRARRPHLDLALTHVDDRIDPETRDRIGADASRLLPLLDRYDFTFLVEDPATAWHLGPGRYPRIAAGYAPLTRRRDRLAVDINIVERYQDVYPTKQQTGGELFQEVHYAAQAFPRVALYFENSILEPDQPLLAAAAAHVTRFERIEGGFRVESPHGVGLRWTGPALVNGRPWPAADEKWVWLPPGKAEVRAGSAAAAARLLDFNGTLESASIETGRIEFSYRSSSRALAVFDREPKRVEIDGAPFSPPSWPRGAGCVLALPPGSHVAAAYFD